MPYYLLQNRSIVEAASSAGLTPVTQQDFESESKSNTSQIFMGTRDCSRTNEDNKMPKNYKKRGAAAAAPIAPGPSL